MIIDIIRKAKVKLVETNVRPPHTIRLSPAAHSLYIAEINQRDDRKHTRIFQILDMNVEIDPHCPPRGAYIIGGEPK